MEIRAREGARQGSIEVFCCYAREDQPLLVQLQKHLKPLQHEGLITLWADIDIDAGTEWEKEIHRHLNTAQIILLLISPDFMASEYCYSVEMQRAIERHEHGEARVIPIILRPVAWQKTRLGKLQALPTDARPITSGKWHHQDEAFYDVAEGIRDAVEVLLAEVERVHKAEEAEQARLAEEELVRKAREEEQAHRIEAEQARLAQARLVEEEKERARLAEEERMYRAKDGQPLTLGISVQSGPDVLIASSIPSQGTKTLRAVAFCALQGHISSVHRVAWSPDGKYLASAGSDQKVFVWEVRTGQHISLYSKHSDEVLCVAWSPDGRHIASGGKDGTVHIWEAVKARSIFVYHPQHHSDLPFWIQAVAWSPQPGDQCIASSSGSSVDGIQLWSAFTGQVLLTYREHPDVTRSLAWSSHGKSVASGGGRKIHVWDAATGKCMLAYRGHAKAISDMAWSPDNQRIASCGDKAVQIRMARDGKHAFTYKGHFSNVSTVTWSPDGKYLASAGGGTVQIWEADTGNLMEKIDISLRSAREYAAWSPKESYLALTGESDTIEIWQIS
jgi:WD40 repeat protein